MDVVRRRNERVEVARLKRAALDEPELAAGARVDLLVLRAAVEADEPPREVVVHGCLCVGRNDEREQRERPAVVAAEQPLADPTAHATLGRRLLVLRGKPARVGEQAPEARFDRGTGFLRGGDASDRLL